MSTKTAPSLFEPAVTWLTVPPLEVLPGSPDLPGGGGREGAPTAELLQ